MSTESPDKSIIIITSSSIVNVSDQCASSSFKMFHGYTQLHGITSRYFVLKNSIEQQLNTGIEIADIMIIEKVIRDEYLAWQRSAR